MNDYRSKTSLFRCLQNTRTKKNNTHLNFMNIKHVFMWVACFWGSLLLCRTICVRKTCRSDVGTHYCGQSDTSYVVVNTLPLFPRLVKKTLKKKHIKKQQQRLLKIFTWGAKFCLFEANENFFFATDIIRKQSMQKVQCYSLRRNKIIATVSKGKNRKINYK